MPPFLSSRIRSLLPLLPLLPLLTLPQAALAQTGIAPSPISDPIHTIRASDNEVGIAADGTLLNYQEALPSPSDTESGWMPGFLFQLSGINPVRRSDASLLYFAVRYRFNQGGVHYQGFVLKNHRPLSTTDDSTQQQVSVRLGKGFQVGHRVLLVPYFLYRFQEWQRRLQANSLIRASAEHYETNSAGLGLMTQWSPANRFVLTGTLAWAEGLSGTVQGTEGILSQPVALHPQATLQADLEVDYRFRGPWHLFGGVDFTHYRYGGSPQFVGFVPAAGGYGRFREPASQSNLLSLDLGVAYHF